MFATIGKSAINKADDSPNVDSVKICQRLWSDKQIGIRKIFYHLACSSLDKRKLPESFRLSAIDRSHESNFIERKQKSVDHTLHMDCFGLESRRYLLSASVSVSLFLFHFLFGFHFRLASIGNETFDLSSSGIDSRSSSSKMKLDRASS